MINTPKLIKLAKEAGYGTQITLFMDGQREDIWGGAMETNKMEKFAELIIKECMMIAKSSHINSSNKKYILEGWNAACYSIHDNIEEYFGVEE